ncbi:unnamed protein product [Eruca vesicaria subsp. sativa]|uniref:Uncharacterized protein n=1 Tax=Eruca vesicaria subsp. sativa TaxID=29727 RepID=A0ABC8JW62_ERUVS|nr:unnamed protein product [Eruca vesicaria subsp. sativa]
MASSRAFKPHHSPYPPLSLLTPPLLSFPFSLLPPLPSTSTSVSLSPPPPPLACSVGDQGLSAVGKFCKQLEERFCVLTDVGVIDLFPVPR